MSLDTICLLTENNRPVFARRGELIAFGEAAREFLASASGEHNNETLGEIEPSDGSPPAFLIGGIGSEAQQAVLDSAKANGHRVQPNHVMFFHCGTCCDPCCDLHPATLQRFEDAEAGLDLAPLSANPLSANPLSANQLALLLGSGTDKVRTTATPHSAPDFLADGGPDGSFVVDDAAPVVYVVDSGLGKQSVDRFRPNVTGDRVDDLDSDGDDCVDAVAGHGTFIAGIVEQLTPGCNIEVVRPAGPFGFVSNGDVDEYSVASLLNGKTMANPTKTIINLSFGGRFYAEQSLLHVEIAAKQARGAVVVASAGNDASCEPSYPAAFPGVIAVGALDSAGKPAPFTNFGSWVNACAEGVDLFSSFLVPVEPQTAPPDVARFHEGGAVWSGTSFVAPVVVAAIAHSMQPGGLTAKEAAAAVLAGPHAMACLGQKVEHPNGAPHFIPGNSS